MQRVGTLLQKLQQQFNEGSTAAQLLVTTQMLQFELNAIKDESAAEISATIISMPVEPLSKPEVKIQFDVQPEEKEQKTVEILQVDELELEAELEEIKRNADVMQKISAHSKPHLLFEPHEDDLPPTLAQQAPIIQSKEINQTVHTVKESINDLLKEPKTELSEKLTEVPVKDLKKAIGINDRFLYINELFRGDEAMYERSIKTINGFSIWPEAEYWIRRELKTKLGWSDSNETVKQFDQLVKRRFI
jgi:hypothetical protein